jgi:hypothetical protein
MDRAPTINRRREAGGVLARLRGMHSNLVRDVSNFPRVGPRYATAPSQIHKEASQPASRNFSPAPEKKQARNYSPAPERKMQAEVMRLPSIPIDIVGSKQTLDDFLNDEQDTPRSSRSASAPTFDMEDLVASIGEDPDRPGSLPSRHYDRHALNQARIAKMGNSSAKIPVPSPTISPSILKQTSIAIIPLVQFASRNALDEEEEDHVHREFDANGWGEDEDLELSDVKL